MKKMRLEMLHMLTKRMKEKAMPIASILRNLRNPNSDPEWNLVSQLLRVLMPMLEEEEELPPVTRR